jgi:hypothetical protein
MRAPGIAWQHIEWCVSAGVAPRDLIDVFADAGAQTADVATQFRIQQAALKFVTEDRDNMRMAARASRDKAAGEPRHSFDIGGGCTTAVRQDPLAPRVLGRVPRRRPRRASAARHAAASRPASPTRSRPSSTARSPCTRSAAVRRGHADRLGGRNCAPFHVLAHRRVPTRRSSTPTRRTTDVGGHGGDQERNRQHAVVDHQPQGGGRTTTAQRSSQEQHLLARPHDEPNFTEILDVTDNSVTGSFKFYRGHRYPRGIKRTRSMSELSPGERFLVDQWLKTNKKS